MEFIFKNKIVKGYILSYLYSSLDEAFVLYLETHSENLCNKVRYYSSCLEFIGLLPDGVSYNLVEECLIY